MKRFSIVTRAGLFLDFAPDKQTDPGSYANFPASLLANKKAGKFLANGCSHIPTV
jgi:hypothetical protein